MVNFVSLFKFIPEVKSPEEKKLGFNVKLKWTLIILGAFFILANIPLFGLSNNALDRFKYLAIILGTDFGSIISLGIGPIVMASVVLQLLTGSGILGIDLTTEEGKKFFQGLQKIMTFFFIIFEAIIYVTMQGLQAIPGFAPIVIAQLILGGIAIYYMDQVTTKYGFGSGTSMFIAAGVAWRLFSGAFQFVDSQGRNCLLSFANSNILCPGKVLILIQSVILQLNTEFLSAAAALIVTVAIFLAVVWAQSLKVEIPLSYGRIRGYNMKWPLSFFYASVIPVILTAALIANIQLFGGIIDNAAAPCLNGVAGACTGTAQFASHFTFLGRFSDTGTAISGFAFWIGSTRLLEVIIRGGFLPIYLLQALTHVIFFAIFSTLFAVFWIKTSGMDAKSQAKKILSSGMQVSGFRQDERILESILERYIMPLTVMGGIAIGLLAAVSDLLGALVTGTGVLLVIMIMFQFYQNIAQQHQVDMNPAFKKFMGNQ